MFLRYCNQQPMTTWWRVGWGMGWGWGGGYTFFKWTMESDVCLFFTYVSCFLYCTPRAVCRLVWRYCMSPVFTLQSVIAPCEVTSGFVMFLPCRRTHRGQEYVIKMNGIRGTVCLARSLMFLPDWKPGEKSALSWWHKKSKSVIAQKRRMFCVKTKG